MAVRAEKVLTAVVVAQKVAVKAAVINMSQG